MNLKELNSGELSERGRGLKEKRDELRVINRNRN